MKLYDLVLTSSWPPKRDPMHYDNDWLLHITDLRRVVRGIPSVFE